MPKSRIWHRLESSLLIAQTYTLTLIPLLAGMAVVMLALWSLILGAPESLAQYCLASLGFIVMSAAGIPIIVRRETYGWWLLRRVLLTGTPALIEGILIIVCMLIVALVVLAVGAFRSGILPIPSL